MILKKIAIYEYLNIAVNDDEYKEIEIITRINPILINDFTI